jgi:hypothetical protein
MVAPYRGNILFRSELLRRGVALVAAVALVGTGAGVGYLALVDRGRPLTGTSATLTEACRYDDDRGGVTAQVQLRSVNYVAGAWPLVPPSHVVTARWIESSVITPRRGRASRRRPG